MKGLHELSSPQACGTLQPRRGSHSGTQVGSQTSDWRDKGGNWQTQGREVPEPHTLRGQPDLSSSPHISLPIPSPSLAVTFT